MFTNWTAPTLTSEAEHRDHATVEQVNPHLTRVAMKHFPAGLITADAAWLTCMVIANNLTRTVGALAVVTFARSRTSAMQSKRLAIPARIATTSGATPSCTWPSNH